MQSVLEEIDTPAEDGAVTRSGGVRRVKNVTTVSPEALSPGGTRSEATADVEDLLYIVNFENEAGYAILGADDRLEPVYAVVDEGSLTAEDFRYAVTVTPEQAEADGELVFPLQIVAQAAIIGIENTDTDADGGVAPMSDDGRHTGDLGGDVLRREYTPFVVQEKVSPLIPVKWGQGYPYNASVTQINGTCCQAGCTAIAVAQVLVSNYWHYGSVVGSIKGTPIDWTLIRRAIENSDLLKATEGIPSTLTTEAKAVSMMMYALGVVLNMDYGLIESSATTTKTRDCLTYVLYKGVSKSTYSTSSARTMLVDRKKACIVRGDRINEKGERKGHAWNLDGWLYRTRYIKTYYRNGTTSLEGPFPQTLVHCNYGWNGSQDGYYPSGIFDLHIGPVEIESGVDSPTKPFDRYYSIDVQIITYTGLP